VVGALRSIIAAPGAAIVHCAAGKDRTGVVVALALTIAGVEPEVIVADYVATNERIEQIIDRLSRAKMYRNVTDKPIRAHEARAETMRAFLEQLDVRYGGVQKWLADNGFTADEVARLRDRLRQP
jgi:protein-tyrosine phosphatase